MTKDKDPGKAILELVEKLHEDRKIPRETIFSGIASAIQIAAERHFGVEEGVLVTIDQSTGHIVARYGGEEFAVVLPATPEKDALELANRIRQAIEKVNFIHAGKRVLLSASLGVAARNPTAFDTPNRFITAADEALYRAKESGRNRVIVAEQANAG